MFIKIYKTLTYYYSQVYALQLPQYIPRINAKLCFSTILTSLQNQSFKHSRDVISCTLSFGMPRVLLVKRIPEDILSSVIMMWTPHRIGKSAFGISFLKKCSSCSFSRFRYNGSHLIYVFNRSFIQHFRSRFQMITRISRSPLGHFGGSSTTTKKYL